MQSWESLFELKDSLSVTEKVALAHTAVDMQEHLIEEAVAAASAAASAASSAAAKTVATSVSLLNVEAASHNLALMIKYKGTEWKTRAADILKAIIFAEVTEPTKEDGIAAKKYNQEKSVALEYLRHFTAEINHELREINAVNAPIRIPSTSVQNYDFASAYQEAIEKEQRFHKLEFISKMLEAEFHTMAEKNPQEAIVAFVKSLNDIQQQLSTGSRPVRANISRQSPVFD